MGHDLGQRGHTHCADHMQLDGEVISAIVLDRVNTILMSICNGPGMRCGMAVSGGFPITLRVARSTRSFGHSRISCPA